MIKHYFQNEKGITLAEVLAVLVVGSFFILLIMGVHVLIQKQFVVQKEDVDQLTDVTIAIKAITKDIRMYGKEGIKEVTSSKISFEDDQSFTIYEFENNMIKKNGAPYIYEIKQFELDVVEDKISLEIESASGKSIYTEIVVR